MAADSAEVAVVVAADSTGQRVAAVAVVETPAPATGSARMPAAAIPTSPGGMPATNARPRRAAEVAGAAVDSAAEEDEVAAAASEGTAVVAAVDLVAVIEAETALAAAPCAAAGEATAGIGLTKRLGE